MNERQKKTPCSKEKFSHMRFPFVYVTDTHKSTAEKKHLHLYIYIERECKYPLSKNTLNTLIRAFFQIQFYNVEFFI